MQDKFVKNEPYRFCDRSTGTYFNSYVPKVREAVNAINYKLAKSWLDFSEDDFTTDDILEMISKEFNLCGKPSFYWDFVDPRKPWTTIDAEFALCMCDDGVPCYVIDWTLIRNQPEGL